MNFKTLFRSNKNQGRLVPARFGSTDPSTCDHHWSEREQWHQNMRAEGRTAWVCRRCHSMTTTYSWQKPR